MTMEKPTMILIDPESPIPENLKFSNLWIGPEGQIYGSPNHEWHSKNAETILKNYYKKPKTFNASFHLGWRGWINLRMEWWYTGTIAPTFTMNDPLKLTAKQKNRMQEIIDLYKVDWRLIQSVILDLAKQRDAIIIASKAYGEDTSDL